MCTFNLLFIRHLGIRLVVDFMFQVVLFVAHPFKFSMKYPRDLISTKFYEVPSVNSFSRFSWVLNGCFFQIIFLLQAKMFKFMNDFVLYWFPCFASFKVYPPSPYLYITSSSCQTLQNNGLHSQAQSKPSLFIGSNSKSQMPRKTDNPVHIDWWKTVTLIPLSCCRQTRVSQNAIILLCLLWLVPEL